MASVRGRPGAATSSRRLGYVCARHPTPIFNNASLFEPDGSVLAAIIEHFDDIREWALWTCDRETSAFAESAGLRRDAVTTAMMADLDALETATRCRRGRAARGRSRRRRRAQRSSGITVAGVVGLEATVVAPGVRAAELPAR